jgi:purine-binding chemotaxis protein CheW
VKPIKTVTIKKQIDWVEAHRRLEAAAMTLERVITPSLEDKKRLLKARAKTLSQDNIQEDAGLQYLEVVEFRLAGEVYGIETSYIREVYPLKELVPIPGTPPFFLGITSVRGQILSVIDIKRFFDLPDKGLTELDKVVIVRSGEVELGIRADVVLGMWSIPRGDIQPSLPTLIGVRDKYLRGVTRDAVIILDIQKLLADENLIVQTETN